jgi:hypothetical protein
MNLIEIFGIIIIHWYADFVLQTDKQERGKSKNWNDLLSHTFTYSLVFWSFIMGVTGLNVLTSFYFWLITFIAHTITDYFTSRLNSRLIPEREYAHNYGKSIDKYSFFRYKNESWHNFFVSVGFDQVLHYVQLFLTYYYLKTL